MLQSGMSVLCQVKHIKAIWKAMVQKHSKQHKCLGYLLTRSRSRLPRHPAPLNLQPNRHNPHPPTSKQKFFLDR